MDLSVVLRCLVSPLVNSWVRGDVLGPQWGQGPVRNTGRWGFTQQCHFPLVLKRRNPTVSISVCVVWWVCHIPSAITGPELCLKVFIDSSFHGPRADRIKCQQQKQRCFIWCHNEENWKHTVWRLWNGISRSPLVLYGNRRVSSLLSFHPMENVASQEAILFPMEVTVPVGGHITHHSHRERRIGANKYLFFNDVLFSLRLIGNSSAIVGFD